MRERLANIFCLYGLIFIFIAGCTLTPTTVNPVSGIPNGVYSIADNKLKIQGSHFTMLTTFDQEVSQGNYIITGNRIQFTETDYSPECGAKYSPYSYQWSFDGKLLIFSNPGDQCIGRVTFMTNTPWKLTNTTP
jgi:hypothetical protein